VSTQPTPEEVPVQVYVAEMEATIARQSSELLHVRTVLRYRDDTITFLQEQNVALQKQITDMQDAGALPQPG
jgi:hypothetical protein